MPGSLHFGVQVCVLTSNANPVPKVVEMLLLHVEINGLYTEGIYRKSGSACRARELHQILETGKKCQAFASVSFIYSFMIAYLYFYYSSSI